MYKKLQSWWINRQQERDFLPLGNAFGIAAKSGVNMDQERFCALLVSAFRDGSIRTYGIRNIESGVFNDIHVHKDDLLIWLADVQLSQRILH